MKFQLKILFLEKSYIPNVMRAYHFLSQVPVVQNSFSLKIIVVAFIGIHVPLFGIIGYLVNSQMPSASAWSIAIFTLIMTLGATGITLFILNKLLKPVIISKEALIQFKNFSTIPNLPTEYDDEGGVLMREVQNTIESLSKIEEERENVLHILRHDLQGPINNSISILRLAKIDKLSSDKIEALENNFETQRKRLLNSIDYIKSQHNLEARKEALVYISLKELILNAVHIVDIEAKAKNIEFEISVDGEEKLELPKILLDRVITNLLDNAIKHSPKNGKILIKGSINKKNLKIDIIDEGDGVPEDVLPYLFKISKAKTEDYNPDKPSMGLGLYLCQKIMKSIGGKISAANNKNSKGAKFSVKYKIKTSLV